MKTPAQRIAKARYEARIGWLREHPGATGDSYGHAHGVMAQAEANISEGYEEPSLEQAEAHIRDKMVSMSRRFLEVDALPGCGSLL